MPIYIDNIIEDFTARKGRIIPESAAVTSKKKVEAVNTSLGKEPGHVNLTNIPGNQRLNESKPADLFRGNIVSGYR